MIDKNLVLTLQKSLIYTSGKISISYKMNKINTKGR